MGYGDAAHEFLLRTGWRWNPLTGDYEREFEPGEWVLLKATNASMDFDIQRKDKYMLFLDDTDLTKRVWLATFENLKEASKCLRKEE
jgi:hypothetical protein